MNPAHRWLGIAAFLALTTSPLLAQSIFTYAGGGPNGDGGPATQAILSQPEDVSFDAAGNLFIEDWRHYLVRRVDASTGIITTVAGGGTSGILLDRPATLSELGSIYYIGNDPAGNLFFSSAHAGDPHLTTFRVDAATGVLTLVGGDATPADGIGDGGPSTGARFYGNFEADAAGNLIIADRDTGHLRVRRIDAITGFISTIAGGGTLAPAQADGGPATDAALTTPQDVTLDASGNVYVSEQSGRIRRVDAVSGIITTWAGGGTGFCTGCDARTLSFANVTPTEIAFAPDGAMYFKTGAGQIYRIAPGTFIVSYVERYQACHGLEVDSAGRLVMGNAEENTVWAIDPDLSVSILAGGPEVGDGRAATAAELKDPVGIAIDGLGRIIVAERAGHRVRRIDPTTHIITTVAGNGVPAYAGIPGPATSASIQYPYGVAVDESGDIFISSDFKVLKVSATDGSISLVAGADTYGYSGDSGPAVDAKFSGIWGIAVNASSIYVTDANNYRVRRIDRTTGIVTTYAGTGTPGYSGENVPATSAQLSGPMGVALDSAGNLFIADWSSHRVRKVDAATGYISTFAGSSLVDTGPVVDGQLATEASTYHPFGLFVNASGDVYVGDSHTVYRVDHATQRVTNFAGSAQAGFVRGDGGRATQAVLGRYNTGILEKAGRLYFADLTNSRIRVVPFCADAVAPALSSPAAGATNTSLAPTLVWTESANAFSYDVVLDTSPTPTTVVAPDIASKAFLLDPISGTLSYTPSNLQPGTTYYWKIVAKGDRFCDPQTTAASTVRSFTTESVCAVPGAYGQSAPIDGATVGETSVLLSWTAAAGASSYDVYAGTANPPPFYATTTATSRSVTSLVPASTYYWYVVARASCDPTLTKPTHLRTFTVEGSCAEPGAIATVAPTNDQTEVPTNTTFQWSGADSATTYDLYLGPTSPPPLFLAGITATSRVVSGLASGSLYYWQVKARVACNASLSSSTEVASFTTAGTCVMPGIPQITFAPPAPVGIGQTYVIAWDQVPGLDEAGTYVIERSVDPGFVTILDTQRTRSTSASFVASTAGAHYHRIHAEPYCDPGKKGAPTAVTVTVTSERPNVIFSTLPKAVLTPLGQSIEDRQTSFTVENISNSDVVVDLPRAELGSIPFFRVVDPFGGSTTDVTLHSHEPKRFEIHFSGPSNATPGSYQGIVYVVKKAAPYLPVVPYAFVNLKVGDEAGATPVFRLGGAPTGYASFPAWAGQADNTRPPLEVEIYNPGSSPLSVGGEIGPEMWLEPEAGWNTNPIPAQVSRVVRLYTRRSRSPNGASFNRATYFTVRTSDGQSARLLVQDNDPQSVTNGRLESLDPSVRTLVVPDVRSNTSVISVLTLTNIGSDVLPVQVIFTPSGSDGFSTAARTATVVVPPNDFVSLADPLVRVFGLGRPAVGQIELRVADAKLGMLIASASLAEAADVESKSAAIPLLPRGAGARAGARHELTGVTKNAELSSDLVLAETSGIDGAEVSIRLYDAGGILAGETQMTLQRYGTAHIDSVVSALGRSALDRGRIHLGVINGAGAVAGILETGNGSHFCAVASEPLELGSSAAKAAIRKSRGLPISGQGSVTTAVAIPFAATGTVDNNSSSNYSTLLGLAAPWNSSAAFTVTFASAAGTTLTQVVNVSAAATVEYPDVLHDLFGFATPSKGSLRVEASPSGSVYSRLTDGVQTVAALPVVETSSEQVVSAATSTTPLHLDGLEQSTDPSLGRRWNVYLTETGSGSGTVTVRLYEAANRDFPFAQADFALGLNEQLAFETIFRALGLDGKDRTGVLCVVVPTSGTARFVASAVAISNETGAALSYLFESGNGLPFSTVQAVSDAPTIAGFEPTSGIAGASVTLTGLRFSDVIGVSFGGVAATSYHVNSASQITAVVPAAAVTGRIVLTSLSGPATSSGVFTVLHLPTITGFTPTSGKSGTAVAINGTHLASATSVMIGGASAAFSTSGEAQINATVPSNASTGPISVTTPAGTATSADLFTFYPTPSISSFTPLEGPVGTSVTIFGSGFVGSASVAFNGVIASLTVDSATHITTTVPDGATTGPITVTTGGGVAASSTNFTVIPPPSITLFTPSSGGAGATVTIAGNHFDRASAVRFNGTSAEFIVNSDAQITATVPAGATTGPVTVTTPGGTVTSAANFTFIPPPAISGFNPTRGHVGLSITISGSAFTGATAVRFNDTNAQYWVDNDSQITATVPPGATTGTISVTTPGGMATSITPFTVVPPPQISSFEPALGTAGTRVTITGSNFTGATSVKFAGTSSNFVINSDSQISTTVPEGASTGVVSVTTPAGTATSAASFTVIPIPVITSFAPTSGEVGTTVTIHGSGLAEATRVAFGGATAIVGSNSSTQIVANVPAGATTGAITVTTAGGTATSETNFTVIVPPNAPAVTSFTPTSGFVGTAVTIAGSGFTGATSVRFGGVAAVFSVSSDTQISAAVPASASTGAISVTTAGGTGTSATSFIVLRVPAITSFTPASGPVGTAVTISGTALSGATYLGFGGTAATVASNTDTQITTSVPAGASTGKISVTTAGGTATSATNFTVTALPVQPVITSFTPTSGPIGTFVTIAGSGFADVTNVAFAGTAASYTTNSSTQITAMVPAGAATGVISVTTAGGTATSSMAFTVVLRPAISSFAPSSGAVGTAVLISGSGFTGATSITFGSTPANFLVQSDTNISTTVPVGALSGVIAVTTPGGIATSAASFTVIPTPAITSFAPTSGEVGTTVTIQGSGLAAATRVAFGGAVANVTSNSSTQIVTNVPAGATTGAITVTTAGGTATSNTSFTVIVPPSSPVVTSFTPTSGFVGTTVTITGSGFTNATAVAFGGVAAVFSVTNDTRISAAVPAGASTGAISVTTAGGTGTSATSFIVLRVPVITSFTPASGPVGTAVTISGTALSGATYLGFGGTAATIASNTDTQITTSVPAGAPTGPISVTTPGGTTTSAGTFTVVGKPAITSFSPGSGPVGTVVTISGSGFAGSTSVKFAGTPANFNINSSTQITASVPAGAVSGVISVTAPGGVAVSSTSFVVIPVPVVSSFTPVSGPVGTAVTLTGSGFTGASSVKFGVVAAQFAVSSSTQIKTTVPQGASTGVISVTTPGGTASSATNFTVIPAPVITSFTPLSGVAGTPVTISGTGFTGASNVKFGVVAAQFTVSSNTQINATVPSGASTGVITVTTPGGIATSPATFIVQTVPAVASFSPTLGVVTALVTLQGSGFAGTTSVRFGGIEANFTIVSNAQITATVPAGAVSGTICVRNAAGSGCSSGSFTVTTTTKPGDLNGDGEITAGDAVHLINALFGGGSSTSGGDVNGDGVVNVADLFYLINYLFAGGAPPRT